MATRGWLSFWGWEDKQSHDLSITRHRAKETDSSKTWIYELKHAGSRVLEVLGCGPSSMWCMVGHFQSFDAMYWLLNVVD